MTYKSYSENKILLITGVSLFYITLSLACDPLAFRLVDLFGYPVTGSALIYAVLYTLLDTLTRISGRSLTIKLIILFHLCDFIFTYLLYLINKLPVPSLFHSYQQFSTVISPLPRLFWAGIIGAMVAGIIEVLIYSFLQKRIKNFFLASSISTIIILLAHNVPTALISYRHIFPDFYKTIIIMNFSISVASLLTSAFIVSLLLKYFGYRNNERDQATY